MTTIGRDIPPRQRTALVFAIVGALAVAGFSTAAALVAVPPALANLASSTADGSTPTRLARADVSTQLVVPDGWTIVRESDEAVTVRTPDGALTARVELVDETPDAVIAAAGASSPVRTEVLASGRDVVHVDAGQRGLIAAVGPLGRDLVPAVRVSATTEEAQMSAYRPALAELLDGIAR